MTKLCLVAVAAVSIVALLVASGTTAYAGPISTIDFEGFAGPAPLPGGATEDGYSLADVGAGGVVTPPSFGSPPPLGTSMGFGPGGPSAMPELEITGGFFQLIGFEFFYTGGSAIPTTVTGYFGGGVVGIDVFTPLLAGVPPGPLPMFTPTALAGVTVDRLVFDMGTGFGAPHILDNIVLNAVPEPSTMLLLGVGLLGVARRRRTRTKTA